MKTPIMDFLIENANGNYASFHMPGHKGAGLYRENGYGEFLDKLMDCDITEVIGADNLFKAEGIIKEAQERYARLYGVRRSYLLVNGSSGGILSAILAAVPKGRKLIMARNSHKSVFNALSIADIQPVYAYPQVIEEYGITGDILPAEIESCLASNPDAEAVILPSPNYYGICSDIEAIADVVHRYGKILIVDQAHGAHLNFFNEYFPDESGKGKRFPLCAERQGADIVINSIHKTLASFTESALLNVCSDKISTLILEDKLQVIETSSPSYILMASLDINASLLEASGRKLLSEWNENLKFAEKSLAQIEGLAVMNADGLDKTKLNLDMSSLGLDGGELELRLLEKGVRAELVTGNILMCMTGIGNGREDFIRLAGALRDVADEQRRRLADKENPPIVNKQFNAAAEPYKGLELCKVPHEKEIIKISDGAGRICASPIIPYPPGIPIACVGERLTQELIDYVEGLAARGEKVIGLSTDGEIIVGA